MKHTKGSRGKGNTSNNILSSSQGLVPLGLDSAETFTQQIEKSLDETRQAPSYNSKSWHLCAVQGCTNIKCGPYASYCLQHSDSIKKSKAKQAARKARIIVICRHKEPRQ